jgi:hypothetical protein
VISDPALSPAAQNVNWMLDRFVADTDGVERASACRPTAC